MVGKAVAQAVDVRQLLPVPARPAFGAPGLGAARDPQQRGNRLDAVVPGESQVSIVEHPAGLGGECRIVLRDDRQACSLLQVLQHRDHELARRAVALDDRHQPLRQGLVQLASRAPGVAVGPIGQVSHPRQRLALTAGLGGISTGVLGRW